MAKARWYQASVYLLVAVVLSLALLAVPGNILADGVTILFEDFHNGLPGNWTVPHSTVTCKWGGGATPNWTDSNPCNRTAYDGCNGTFMIADSYCCGPQQGMDTELRTPPIDCSCYDTVRLEFDHYYLHDPDDAEKGDVDVSSDGGGNWTNIRRYEDDAEGHVSVNISAWAAGESDVRVRWHYYNAFLFGYWEVDNVRLSGIPQAPVAAFNATPTSCCAALTVNFTDQSTGCPTDWNWTFGDGDTSTAQHPSHNYTNAGTYNVSLNVSNVGGSDSTTKLNYITVGGLPTADFIANVTSGCVPLTVQFTDKSTANNKPITDWNWTFGDGGTSTAQHPSHNYVSAGTYDVTLTVTNACGSNSTAKTDFITVSEAPVAAFNATPTSGCIPLTVNFTDQSTGGPTSWDWTFGDSGTSTAQYPSHQYTSAGTYNVSLNVSNACGSNSTTKLNYITVGGPPTADFTANVTTGCAPLTVQFTDKSTANNKPITDWNWTFLGGVPSSANTQGPHSITYNSPGNYTVTLNITNACGSNITAKTDFITASPCPVGGEAYPIDKTSVLALWIAVAVLLAGGISWYALRGRRAHS